MVATRFQVTKLQAKRGMQLDNGSINLVNAVDKKLYVSVHAVSRDHGNVLYIPVVNARHIDFRTHHFHKASLFGP